MDYRNIGNASSIILDFETSDTDFLNGQVHSVFACVINEDGEEIDSYENFCRSESFRLSSPKALFVNGIKNDVLFEGAHPLDVHLELKNFISKYPGVPIVAYNANFDFKFAFQGLFQAGDSEPYFWKKNRSIVCAHHLTRAQYMNDPSALNVPLVEGQLSFKQENIGAANGIFFPRHSAKGDVLTCRAIVNKIKKNSSDLIYKAEYFGKKANTLTFLHKARFIVAPCGWKNNFSVRCLVPLAFDSNESNFLALDIGMINPTDISMEEQCPPFSATYISGGISKKSNRNFPFVKLPINQGMLFEDESMWKASEPSSGVDFETLCERAASARNDAQLIDVAERALIFDQNRFTQNSSKQSLEERLFEGFSTPAEKSFLYSLNSLPIEDRYNFLIETKEFSHNRYHQLAKRYLLDAFPELCSKHDLNKFWEWRLNRLTFGPAKFMTFMKAKKELEKLYQEYPGEEKRLDEIRDYLDRKADLVSLDYSDI